MLTDKSLRDFTKEIASKTSTPGGGGASSLVSSVAIALGDMVGEFTIGKEKYKDVESDIILLMEKAEILRLDFIDLIEEDAKAFLPLSKAYAIPKDDPNRESIMEECLKNAMSVPLTIFNKTLDAIDILNEFYIKGSKIIKSDAVTGAVIALGALKGAAVNVKVNTRLLKDKELAKNVEDHIDSKVEEYEKIVNKIYSDF